ncbi:MAG: hypothetical protein Q9183_002843 [Haloplaca sp. 2 TL-2023]
MAAAHGIMADLEEEISEQLRRKENLKQYGEPRDEQLLESETFACTVVGWKLPNGAFDPWDKRQSIHCIERDRVDLKHFTSLLKKRSKAVAALEAGQEKDLMTEHFGKLHALSKGWVEEVEELSMSWRVVRAVMSMANHD